MSSPLVLPAIASAGTHLFLGSEASPSIFTTYLSRLGNIDFNGIAIDMVDVSNQDSVAHRVLGTLLKNGDLNAVLYFEPTSAQDVELFDIVLAPPPPLRSWQIEWPDGQIWQFNAYLSKFTPKADVGKALEAAITLSIDNVITVI